LTLYADGKGSSLASSYERDLSHVGAEMMHHEIVLVKTLDALAEKHGLSHVAFLKLDLEEHELEALKGAKNLFERGAIDVF
jgi:FkbM family methyltransferase